MISHRGGEADEGWKKNEWLQKLQLDDGSSFETLLPADTNPPRKNNIIPLKA